MRNTRPKATKQLVLASAGIIATAGILAVLIFFKQPAIQPAGFEECKQAGGAILETYPEQCMINGVTHVNKAQQADAKDKASVYIGLAESAALEQAEKSGIPARIIIRDDESLPVTMDFVYGRYNFHSKDGVISFVEVEGQAGDTPLGEEAK